MIRLKEFTYNFVNLCWVFKQSTQNTFIYGELGRMPYQIFRYFHIRYWLKVINRGGGGKYVLSGLRNDASRY